MTCETFTGSAGDDTFTVDDECDVIIEEENGGNDTVQSSVTYTLPANVENITLTGTASINATGNNLANVLIGNSGNNSLNGAAGNDTLDGGAGTDTLVGGTGDDTYIVNSTTDTITENAGEGTDTVQSSVTYTLGSNLENLTLTGTSNISGTGNSLNNVITGNSGANTLTGADGNDTLDGGLGTDRLVGGLGDDVYYLDNASEVVVENSGAGTDTVYTTATDTLATNVENMTLLGSANINATGNSSNNVLTGNSGNNVLDGSGGIDTLVGGLGDDSYVVNSTTDTITELTGEGTDTVQSSVTYTLGSNIENLTLTGSSNISGTGNSLDNYLLGNSGSNTLTGGAGNDTLSGGSGGDRMEGGLGDDTYIVAQSGDVVIENINEGTDTVQSSITYTLGNHLENLTLTGTNNIHGTGNTLNNYLTGNSGANSLTGGAGHDTLDGGAGNDTLIGGDGDDTYIVNVTTDVITESGTGLDTVQSAVTWTLGSNLENLTLTGTSSINGTGNSLNNWITGNSAANSLSGAAGDDTLDGGAGVDTLVGGTGNDSYIVDSTTDTITENTGEGTDTVLSSVTYTLGSNLENLTLTGTAAISGTGNSLNNQLTGNSGANSLSGADGDDVLDGAAGSDTLAGGLGDDTYLLNGGGGTDSIQESGGFDLVRFGSSTTTSDVAFFSDDSDLDIGYSTSDYAVVVNQSGSSSKVDRFELDSGLYLTADEVNQVIQEMAAYAAANSISFTSITDVQASQDLMNIIASSWHS